MGAPTPEGAHSHIIVPVKGSVPQFLARHLRQRGEKSRLRQRAAASSLDRGKYQKDLLRMVSILTTPSAQMYTRRPHPNHENSHRTRAWECLRSPIH